MLRDLPDYAAARAAAEEGLTLARESGNWRYLGWALYILASVIWFDRYVGQGAPTPLTPDFDAGADPGAADDEARAIGLLDESLAIYRQHGVTRHVAIVLSGGGSVGMWGWARGDFARAEAAYAEAIELHWRMGSLRELADCLVCLGRVALGQGRHRRSARLLGAASAAYDASRTRFLPIVWPQPEDDQLAARARMGDEAFEAAFAEGRALSLEQAVGYVLGRVDPFRDALTSATDPPPSSATLSSRGPTALTPREREVAVLVGRGYSNRRIADALVIAEKTAEVHARNIREKLGLSSRSQIAAWVAQHGLLTP